MFPHFEERLSDSPFVERIWSTQSDRAGSFTSIATVFWSMVISKWRGYITISLYGSEIGATCKEFPVEVERFGIARLIYIVAFLDDTVKGTTRWITNNKL